jgi:hypothetical protein
MKRIEFDKISKRATPSEWANYSVASTVIKLFNNSDTGIGCFLRNAVYINDRQPGRGKFIDESRLKVGRQALPYRIGPIFSKIGFDWVGINSTDDTIRWRLKTQFFKYFDKKEGQLPT